MNGGERLAVRMMISTMEEWVWMLSDVAMAVESFDVSSVVVLAN